MMGSLPRPSYHVIRFYDLVDLWVIKIKSLWSFARVVHREQVNRARNADHAAKTCERFCLFCSQNNKIFWLANITHMLVWEIHEVRKGLWAFFSIVYFGCWLAEQANSDHVVITLSIYGFDKYHCLCHFPADPHIRMETCCDFGHPRLNQRFEVVDEPINSICSKFSKSKSNTFVMLPSDSWKVDCLSCYRQILGK